MVKKWYFSVAYFMFLLMNKLTFKKYILRLFVFFSVNHMYKSFAYFFYWAVGLLQFLGDLYILGILVLRDISYRYLPSVSFFLITYIFFPTGKLIFF